MRVVPIIALAGMCAVLAGCQQLQTIVQGLQAGQAFTVTQSELDALRSGYDAAFLTPAAHYRSLGFCKTGTVATLAAPCADRTVVAKLVQADNVVAQEFSDVQAMITGGDNTGLQAAYTTLQSGVTTAEALIATYQVK